MAPAASRVVLTEKEQAEFDNVTLDQITSWTDTTKLCRLEQYMRQEGFDTTAQAVVLRLQELGTKGPKASGADNEAARHAYLELQKELKSKEHKLSQASPAAASTYAPIRQTASAKVDAGGKLDAAPKPSNAPLIKELQDSKFGGQVRSGAEYYDKWSKFADQEVKKLEQEESQQKPATATGATAGVAPGPNLTRKLVETNQDLTDAERQHLAENEKAKGNELFRAGEFAAAVEKYTLAIGLDPQNPSLYGNRAAAYLKLKLYEDVDIDCTRALQLQPGNTKVLQRRAMARLERKQLAGAKEDCQTALALAMQSDPAQVPAIKQVLSRVEQQLATQGLRKIAVEEVSDDDEEISETVAAPAPTASSTGSSADASSSRTRISVVEESESEDDAAAVTSKAPQAAVLSTQPNVTSEMQPTVAAAGVAKEDSGSWGSGDTSPKQTPAAGDTRKKITVVEESDSDDELQPAQPSPADASAATPAAVSTTPVTTQQAVPVARAGTRAGQPAASGSQGVTDKQATQEAQTGVATSAVSPEPTDSSTPLVAPVQLPPDFAVELPDVPLEVESFDAHVEGIRKQANEAFKADNLTAALRLYKQALELQPASDTLYVNRAMTYLKKGWWVKALEDAAQATALNPANSKALHKRATAKKEMNLFTAANADYRSCIKLIPSDNAADRRRVEDDVRACITAQLEAAKREKERPKPAAKVAKYKHVVIEEEEEPAKSPDEPVISVEEMERIEQVAAKKVTSLQQRAGEARQAWEAEALKRAEAQQRERLKEAEARYKQQLEQIAAAKAAAAAAAATANTRATAPHASIEVTAPPAHSTASTSSRSAEPLTSEPPAAPVAQAADARLPFSTASSHAPPSVNELKELGNELFKAHKYEEACRLYQQALALDPDNLAVHANLANVRLKMGDYYAAKQHCDTVIKAHPAPAIMCKVLHRRAQANHGLKKYRDSLEDYSQLRKIWRFSPTVEEEADAVRREYEASLGIASSTAQPGPAVPQPVAIHAASAVEPAAPQGTPQAAEAVSDAPRPPSPTQAAAPSASRLGMELAGDSTGPAAAAAGPLNRAPLASPPAPPAPGPAATPDSTQHADSMMDRQELTGEAAVPSAPQPPSRPMSPGPAVSVDVTDPFDAVATSDTALESLTSEGAPDAMVHADAQPQVADAAELQTTAEPLAAASKPEIASGHPGGRTRIVVVEEDSEEEEPESQAQPEPQAPLQSAVPALSTSQIQHRPASEITAAAQPPVATSTLQSTNQEPSPASTSVSQAEGAPTVPPTGATSRRIPVMDADEEADGDAGVSQEAAARATALKERGNQLFQQSKLDEALECYSQCIQLNPHFAQAYANRSLVYMRKRQYAEAIKDGNTAVNLDPTYTKAKHRLAVALAEVANYEESLHWYQQVAEEIAHEERPKVHAEIERVKKLAEQLAHASPSAAAAQPPAAQHPPSSSVTPSADAQHPQSAAPAPSQPLIIRHKIQIEDVEDTDSDGEGYVIVQPVQPSPAARLNLARAAAQAEKPSMLAQADGPSTATSSANAPSTSSVKSTPVPAASAKSAASSAPPTISTPSPASTAPSANTAPTSTTSPAPATAAGSKAADKPGLPDKVQAAVASLAVKMPARPKTAVEFTRSCKTVESNPDVLLSFIKSIPPGSYPDIFKNNLEPTHVGYIVKALKADVGQDASFAAQSLEALTRVPRFATTVSPMLHKAVKQDIADMVPALEQTGHDMSAVRKAYRV